MSTPTAVEQFILQLVNRARQDPSGEVSKLITGTSPLTGADAAITSTLQYYNVDVNLLKQLVAGSASLDPLAWNSSLDAAAAAHSALMIQDNQQAHVLPGEQDLGTRFQAAGYTNWSSIGENIYAYATDPLYADAGFFIDWGNGTGGMQSPAGHRANMLSSSFTEVGIDATSVSTSLPNVGPLVVTEDFGTTFNYKAQIVGVVFNDSNNDAFYSPGEGIGGVTVKAVGAQGTFTTTTWSSGGYELAAPAGQYAVTFSGGGLTSPTTKMVVLGSSNVEVDDINTNASGSIGLLGSLSTTQQLELIYVGYFNRSADSGGFSYWSGQAATTSLTNIANLFTPQAETIAIYSFLANSNPNFSSPGVQAGLNTFIGNVYSNLFGHAADSGGLTYWTSQIAGGAVGLGAAILAIANGATGADATILQNKIAVALDFTTLTGAANLNANAAYLAEAKTVLAHVDGASLNDASVTAAEALIAPWIATQPHSALPLGVVGTGTTTAHAELM